MYIRRVRVPRGLGNRKMFTTIWSKVFAHQRALISVLSSPLANWTLTPLCTSYWPRESKICLSVGQSSLKQTPEIDNPAQYYCDSIFSMRAKTSEKSTREKKRNFSHLSSAGIQRHICSMPFTVPLICATGARMLWRNIWPKGNATSLA